MATDFNFDRVLNNFSRLKKTVPLLVANATRNYFVQNFKSQSFDGQSWQEVQRRISGTNANKYAKPASKTRDILIQSGKLKRSVSTSLRLATFDKIQFLIDGGSVPYAKVHNDGGRAGRGAGFQMPKRRFIGDTKELRKKQIDIIVNSIDKIWN